MTSVDEQFKQAVSAAAQAIHDEDPGWPDTMAKAALKAVHLRDYIELAEELRKYQALENGADASGLAGLSWQYIETILARIDAHQEGT